MTGIVNSTGARSGIIGTTVGTADEGIIGQIVQTVENGPWVAAANTNEQLIHDGDYSCCITPAKAGSKILINYTFDVSSSGSVTARSYMERVIASGSHLKLTGIHGTDPGGSYGDSSLSSVGVEEYTFYCNRITGTYLDSPSYTLGEQMCYRIGVQSETASHVIHVGRTNRDNSQYHPRTASILILMEVYQ